MQPSFPAPPAPATRSRWTPAKQRVFLLALVDSGSVARAAAAAGMSRSSAHRLRARLAGTPFDHAWDQALARWTDAVANPFDPALAPVREQSAR